MKWGGENLRPGAPKLSSTLAKLRAGPRIGALLDAANDEDFIQDFINGLNDGTTVEATDGQLVFSASPNWEAVPQDAQVRFIGAEQTNLSMIVDERVMLKIYRRVRSGVQPELELARFLTDVAHYENTPRFLGAIEHVASSGERTALAIAFSFVPNQGDAWNAVVDALDRAFEDLLLVPADDETPESVLERLGVFPLDIAKRLGERTAELHRALATPTADAAFAPEPIADEDIARWCASVRADAQHVFDRLEAMRPTLPEATALQVVRLLDARGQLDQRIEAIPKTAAMGVKTRIHGDYHLGQVLVSKDDVVIIDFEGEPGRTLDERREKNSPLRDVAGMLRSLDYAASSAADRFATRRGELPDRIWTAATAWRNGASRDFMEAYSAVATPGYPPDERVAAGLLDLFLLQKAFYEIAYEAANRPTWLPIPLRSVLDLLAGSNTYRT